MAKERGRRLIAQNRKARHDYHIDETFEAGLVLTGTEVKSLRAGRATLADGYAVVMDGEIWLQGVHIAEYTQGTWTNHPPRRTRKLLLHRKEIERIGAATRESGITIVPLAMYFKDGRVKIEIGLARGKRNYDKRQAIAKREADRETARAMAHKNSGRDR
ncbi:SsrA-binding protein SmpB [Actinopolymorpha sp. B17G11]|uniref:SsrA-binding protein SmpB n=1 Tax=unclassified Actinopolymorpha TaxID=2627063 RepID=UPI0032D90570